MRSCCLVSVVTTSVTFGSSESRFLSITGTEKLDFKQGAAELGMCSSV